ncbi:MAG: MFS transporter [Planctomycetota bacterium]
MLRELLGLPGPLRALFASTAVLRLGAFVYPYLAIYLTRERGFSTLDAGWILAAGGLGLMLGNLVGGQMADSVGRKTTLLCALAINAAGYLALLSPHETGTGYALSLGFAYLGMGMFTPAAQAAVSDLAPDSQRTLAYTGFYLSSNLGIALGPLVGGILASQSFTLVFVGDVVSTLICAALLLLGLPGLSAKPGRSTTSPPPRALRAYGRHPRVVLVCAAGFFLTAPLMGLEYAVPLLVEREFAAPLHWVGVVYTINAVTILICSFWLERTVRGKPELPFLMIAAVLWTTGLLVLGVGWSVAAILGSTLIWTLGEILTSILIPSYVAGRVAPEVKGRFLALVDLGRSTATLVAPVGLGYLWNSHGSRSAVGAILGVSVLGIAAFVTLNITRSKRAELLSGGAS